MCPNCWHEFPPEAVLWISVHSKLADEALLPALDAGGSRVQRRFVPERFDAEGRALDAEGAPCTQVACPRCRLQIPRAALELPTFVLSVFGTPMSGKSVYLASMVFTLRQQAARLGLRFQDADLVLNKSLLDDERRLFLDSSAETYRVVREAVAKTQLVGGRHQMTVIEGHAAELAPPYTFLIAPTLGHPQADEGGRLARLLCLYDNAGELFRPGADKTEQPTTRHLAAAQGLIFTFDPTQYRSVRKKLKQANPSEQSPDRQDAVLLEAGRLIREHAGLPQTARVPQPLVVVLTKYDVWWPLLPESVAKMSALRPYPGSDVQALALDVIEALSAACRGFLMEYAREVVAAAEGVAEEVVYVPVAALGWEARVDAQSGDVKFRTADCDPFGVLVPLLYLMRRGGSSLPLAVRKKSS
jgi:hypothetical protein